jgi:hypothetical protein
VTWKRRSPAANRRRRHRRELAERDEQSINDGLADLCRELEAMYGSDPDALQVAMYNAVQEAKAAAGIPELVNP